MTPESPSDAKPSHHFRGRIATYYSSFEDDSCLGMLTSLIEARETCRESDNFHLERAHWLLKITGPIFLAAENLEPSKNALEKCTQFRLRRFVKRSVLEGTPKSTPTYLASSKKHANHGRQQRS